MRWYRTRVGPAAVRVLLPAALVLAAGSMLVTHGLLASVRHRLWVGLLGLAMVASGPLAALLGLLRLLARDDVLVVRSDGLERVGPGERWFEPWDDVALIEAVDGRTVRLTRRDGTERLLRSEPFGPGAAGPLARDLERYRQKGSWGLL